MINIAGDEDRPDFRPVRARPFEKIDDRRVLSSVQPSPSDVERGHSFCLAPLIGGGLSGSFIFILIL